MRWIISFTLVTTFITPTIAQEFWVSAGLEGKSVQNIISGPDTSLFAHIDLPGSPARSELYRSLDGGITWVLTTAGLPPIFTLSTMFTDSIFHTYVALNLIGAGDSLYQLPDGDSVWVNLHPPGGGYINSGLCTSTGLMFMGRIYIFRSDDYGGTWDTVYDPLDGETVVRSFALTASGDILSSGDAWQAPAWQLRSSDDGLTWSTASIYSFYFNEMVVSPNGSILGLDDLDQLCRSVDDGATWTIRDSSLEGHSFLSILVDKNGKLYSCGGGKIYSSENEGLDWVDITYNNVYGAGSLAMRSDGHLYLGTANGVWKSTESVTGVGNTPPSNPSVYFALYQNYPNPFNATTTIEYDVPENTNVYLKVFNVAGEEVKMLVNQFESPGRKMVRWDASGRPSGMYFYHLRAGKLNETRPMILLK